MFCHSLRLKDIRSHHNVQLSFDPGVTVLLGPNASGKTTIIEAIHMLSTGDSFRAQKIDELIKFDADLGRIVGKVRLPVEMAENDTDDGRLEEDTLEILLTHGMVQGKRAPKRIFSINGVKRQKRKAVGKFVSVVFRPEDLRLIEGSPARRREFFDTPLTIVHPEYERALRTYEQTLRRRNKLLQQVREKEQPASSLQYWNMSLIKNGVLLQKYRREFLETWVGVEFPVEYKVHYDPSVISQERQEQYIAREIASGHTLIGPHKDDFRVELCSSLSNKQSLSDIALYGSRGEQRLAVLWLKQCELHYVRDLAGQDPVLLLDDIFSELDDQSHQLVLNILTNGQTVITSADEQILAILKKRHKPKVIRLAAEL